MRNILANIINRLLPYKFSSKYKRDTCPGPHRQKMISSYFSILICPRVRESFWDRWDREYYLGQIVPSVSKRFPHVLYLSTIVLNYLSWGNHSPSCCDLPRQPEFSDHCFQINETTCRQRSHNQNTFHL